LAMNEKTDASGENFDASITPRQIRRWEREAEILNRQNRGDQACFYLRRKL